MQIQVETDNHIEGRQALSEHVQGVIEDAVDKYRHHVTHVTAHLGDLNSGEKAGSDDMRCLLEARVTGVKNIAVSHQAESLHLAIEGAADKLQHALASSVGKLQDQQLRAAPTGQLNADLLREDPDAV